MPGTLHGKVAIVTGAARGIGFAIARRLAREGALLLIADVNGPGAAEAAAALATADGTTAAVGANITDERDRQRVVAAALERWQRIDVLVNNAGILPRVSLLEVTPEIWRRTMDVDLDAAFFLSQAVLPIMRDQQEGRIVNIASMSARTGGQASPPHYATAKTGLVGMTRALARVTGVWGVTVNAVAPGIIDTEMIADWLPGQREWWESQIPLGRLGTPEDVAGVVAFLAGPDAGYITGTTVDINGGYYMN